MPSPSSLYHGLHQALELLYFASGITIAVAAIWGLQQLRITRQIARTNAKREALKFAAERCQYYAEVVVPLKAKMVEEYDRLGLRFLSNHSKWAIQDGEIVKYNFETKLLDAEVPKLFNSIVYYLNALEAFAIPFVASVADDDLGYQEAALSFCSSVKLSMPAFFQMRRKNAARYESTIKLYDLWNKRMLANASIPTIESMTELVKSVEKERIKPIGTEQ
jgi:hypothetical protein